MINATEYLSQPVASIPDINPFILLGLIAFGILITCNGYVDQKKGVLLPNRRYWTLPAIVMATTLSVGWNTGQITTHGWLFSLLLIAAYTMMVYVRNIGGADYFALCLSTILISMICDWPFLIMYLLICGAFLPLINELMHRVAYILHHLKTTGEDPQTVNFGSLWAAAAKASPVHLRLIPLFAFGYWAVIAVWVLLFGFLY